MTATSCGNIVTLADTLRVCNCGMMQSAGIIGYNLHVQLHTLVSMSDLLHYI